MVHLTENWQAGSDYENIKFDSMPYNFGNHFNLDTSSFICPYRGVYMFSANYNAVAGKRMFFQLMKSGVNKATAWADFLDTFSSQASLFALIECNAGEIIYAQARYKNDHLYGYNKRLQFSGYLLQKLI